jgi:hypothetical protein
MYIILEHKPEKGKERERERGKNGWPSIGLAEKDVTMCQCPAKKPSGGVRLRHGGGGEDIGGASRRW